MKESMAKRTGKIKKKEIKILESGKALVVKVK